MQFARGLKALDGFVKTKTDSVARKRTVCGAIREGRSRAHPRVPDAA